MANPSMGNTIYKTVTADGTVVYSDIPNPESTPVSLGQVNGAVVPALASPGALPNDKTLLTKKNKDFKIVIHSPASGETIRSNVGDVMVNFEISPEYVGKFYLLLDNQVVNTKGKTQIKLTNVDRGEHSIEVQLRDNSGKIFASSQKQTFYLHQASALINAN